MMEAPSKGSVSEALFEGGHTWAVQAVTEEDQWGKHLPLTNETLSRILTERKGFIAGGVFKDVLQGRSIKDVDIFFHTEDAWLEAIAWAKEDENWQSTYSTENCQAFTVTDTPSDFFGPAYQVELINATFGSPGEVLSSFDFTISQAALYWDGGFKFMTHPQYRQALEAKSLVVDPAGQLQGNTLERIARYNNYGFTPTPDTFNRAVDSACATAGCEARPSKPTWEEFFSAYTAWASRVEAIHAYRNSFSISSKITNDSMHYFFHALWTPQGKQAVETESIIAHSILEAFTALHPAANETWLRLRSVLPLSGFLEHMPALEQVSDEVKALLLTLLGGQFFTHEDSWWANARVALLLTKGFLTWDDPNAIAPFLRGLANRDRTILAYEDWLNFLESPMFHRSAVADFAGTLFEENTKYDRFSDRMGNLNRCKMLFGLPTSKERSPNPPF